jgi:hypothetical protein
MPGFRIENSLVLFAAEAAILICAQHSRTVHIWLALMCDPPPLLILLGQRRIYTESCRGLMAWKVVGYALNHGWRRLAKQPTC